MTLYGKEHTLFGTETLELQHKLETRNREMLTASHWRGFMIVAFVLGVAWINLSRLPTDDLSLRLTDVLANFAFTTVGGEVVLLLGLLFATLFTLFSDSMGQLPRINLAKAISIGFMATLFMVDIGGFLMHKGYGKVTVVPWGIESWGAMRHPVLLYDATLLLIVLWVLWSLRKRILAGELLWRFLMFYSLSRLFLGMFYATSVVWGPGIRVNQIIALITLLVSLFVLSFFAQQRERVN